MEGRKTHKFILSAKSSVEANLIDYELLPEKEKEVFLGTFGDLVKKYEFSSPTMDSSEEGEDDLLVIDMSSLGLDAEDINLLAALFNNSIKIKEIVETKMTTFQGLRKLTSLCKKLSLPLSQTINPIKATLYEANPILILVDLNGTLLCRTSKKIDIPYEMKLKHNYVYLRPGASHFLSSILFHPRAVLAFYSSIMFHNITPLINILFKKPPLKTLRNKVLAVFDGHYCPKDSQGQNDWDTMRDLNMVWKAKPCKGRFGKANTLLIDDDQRKVKNWSANALLMLPYDDENASKREYNNTYFMKQSAIYIQKMLDTTHDVREYLLTNPDLPVEEEKLLAPDLEFAKYIKKKEKTIEEMKKKAEKREKLKLSESTKKEEEVSKKEDEKMEEKEEESNPLQDLESEIMKKMEFD